MRYFLLSLPLLPCGHSADAKPVAHCPYTSVWDEHSGMEFLPHPPTSVVEKPAELGVMLQEEGCRTELPVPTMVFTTQSQDLAVQLRIPVLSLL